jgi:hypothetical protein
VGVCRWCPLQLFLNAGTSGERGRCPDPPYPVRKRLFNHKTMDKAISVMLELFAREVEDFNQSIDLNLGGLSLSENIDEESIKAARTQLEGHGASLALDTTKMTLAMSKPPYEHDVVQHILQSMKQTIQSMVYFVGSCPPGKNVSKMWKTTLQNVLEGLLSVFSQNNWINLQTKQTFHVSNGTVYQRAGLLWEACNLFKQVPLSNKAACLQLVKEQHELFKDVSREMVETLEDLPGDVDPELRNLVKACNGLVKLTEMVVHKLSSRIIPSIPMNGIEDAEVNSFLDNMVDQVTDIQTQIDDTVCELQELVENASSFTPLIEGIKTLLVPKCQTLIQTCTVMPGLADEHDKWFEMAKGQYRLGVEKLDSQSLHTRPE